MTTTLAFDAASSAASCALVRDGELVGERLYEPRRLLAGIAELLGACGLRPADLDAIVVGTGPGSFTSIRIALATARALCLALGIPAAGVTSLRALAGGRPVIDARRGEVFSEGPWVGAPDTLEVAGERLVGDGARAYRHVFEAAGAEVPPDADPLHLPAASRLLAAAGPFAAAELIEPLYVRAPDARLAR